MSYSAMAHALTNYVESHLEHFSLPEMSKCFGFSEIYLRELFLKNVNMPVMQYYRRQRLLVSAYELLHSDKTIMSIALESGFSSHESYSRAFRKCFGMSPSQFRARRPLTAPLRTVKPKLDTAPGPKTPGGFSDAPFAAESFSPVKGAAVKRRNRNSPAKHSDTCVHALKQPGTKKDRSDESMTTQDSNHTILYGMPEIKLGTYKSNTMFPICVKAVSEYLGDDVSYARIMAATGAAFRLVWNRSEWDLSNVDIYHTLRESNEVYAYGAKVLGREFSFLGRDADTAKEDFAAYIRSNLAKGSPVIALGIIGPPEPCIIAGYDADQDAVMGWNFFQHDPEFASAVTTMENGYFRCASWWENTDTQAVMCIGSPTGRSCSHKDILKMAAAIMEPRQETSYAKGLLAYDAWKEMLLDEKWFENSAGFDSLFSMLLVQNDAMKCISDGRKWAAEYLRETALALGEAEASVCRHIAEAFLKVSGTTDKMSSLIGDWRDTDKMLQNFGSRTVREELGRLTVLAKKEDESAYEQLKILLNHI